MLQFLNIKYNIRREYTSEFNLKDLSTFGIEIDKKSNPVVTQTRQILHIRA